MDRENTRAPYPPYHPRSDEPPRLAWTDDEFRAAFRGEGDLLEFKQGVSATRIQEAAVAFSNTRGGVVVVGVTDEGEARGVAGGGEQKASLHRALRDARDVGRYEIHDAQVGDKGILAVAIAKREEGFAQTPDGRVLVRRGAMNVPLLGQELALFAAERALGRFESTPSDVSFDEADPGLRAQVSEAFGWSVDEFSRFESRGLATTERGRKLLTVAGVLCLTQQPERVLPKASIEILRYREGAAYDRRVEVIGPIQQQVAEATDLISAELGSELVVLGVRRHELPRIPANVLREAIANAVAHRRYDGSAQTVKVEIRPDAVTIRSPGPLPEPVTVSNIREQNAARNVAVIDTLRRLRLAEDLGMGVDLMQDQMQAHLLQPPEFVDDGTSVTVRLPLAANATPEERAWLDDVEARGEISPQERIVLVHGARGEALTNSTVREILDVDSTRARTILKRLSDSGFLRRSGERSATVYLLAGSLRPPGGLRLSVDEIRDAICELAIEQPVTNRLVRERFGIDRVEAKALLGGLVAMGRLAQVGERRGTRYVLPDGDRP